VNTDRVSTAPGASPVRRLFAIPVREVGDLILAQWSLVIAFGLVRIRRKGELLRRAQTADTTTGPRDEQRLARVATALDRVSRFGPIRPTCLVRALALERMIRRAHAGPAVVRVGVLRSDGQLFAHAWIELGGRVIGDEPAHVRRFTPLHDFSALAP
jgi:hypothetical protein